MTARTLSRLFIFPAILIIALSGTVLSGDEGKIPITTSSEKALHYYLQGRDLADRLQGQESLKYFEMAVEKDPEFAIAYWDLAFAQPTNIGFFKMFDKAKAFADKASKGEQLMIKATEVGIGGHAEEQLNYVKELVAAYPNDERAHNQLGTNYFGRQDYAMAIEEYNKAIEINPEFSPPYNQLGYAHRFLENYELAEKAFKQYIKLIPDSPNPYDSYAELLMKMGRHEESIAQYKKALEISPNFVMSHIGIATNLTYMNMHEKARDQLQVLYDGARDNGERRAAHFARVVSYVDENRMDKALEELKLQYALAEEDKDIPSMAGDHLTMVNILIETGEYDKAATHIDKAEKLIQDSDLPEAVKENAKRFYVYNTARIDAMKGDIPQAKEKAEKYRGMVEKLNNPAQIRLAHELAAVIALEEKDYDTAIDELNKSNKQNPYNCYRMVLALDGKGEKEKAKQMCHKACNFNALNSLNYAFIRNKAETMLASM